MSKPSNLTVKPRRKESQERMIKRFIKKCKKLGIIDEVKDRRFFKSNSEKRNEAKSKSTSKAPLARMSSRARVT